MKTDKVITVMCASRLPAVLVARIDAAAKSGGVSRAQFIAEACRLRLDGQYMKDNPVVLAPPKHIEPTAEEFRRDFPTTIEELRQTIKTIEQGHAACDPEYVAQFPSEVCGFRAFNDIDGETYTCGKPQHGKKVPHGAWAKADA